MTSRSAQERIDKELAAIGITPFGLVINGRRAYAVTCRWCGQRGEHLIHSEFPTQGVVRVFRQHGWEISKHSPIHHDCIKLSRATIAPPEKRVNNTPKSLGPDPKIARKIFAALDDHFDEARRLYKPGYSDEAVAKHLDVSTVLVEGIRKGAYGELAEDPAVTEARRMIDALRADLEVSKQSLLDLVETELAPFKERIEKLEATLIRAGAHRAAG